MHRAGPMPTGAYTSSCGRAWAHQAGGVAGDEAAPLASCTKEESRPVKSNGFRLESESVAQKLMSAAAFTYKGLAVISLASIRGAGLAREPDGLLASFCHFSQ